MIQLLHNISWDQFESLLVELGDRRASRIAYDNGSAGVSKESGEGIGIMLLMPKCSNPSVYCRNRRS